MTRSRVREVHSGPAAWPAPAAGAASPAHPGAAMPPSPVAIDGRCFAYVFPCRWEDHCKIGFSSDPLGRIGALHRRWFEFFDLERGALVEAESVLDARELELALRAGLREHNAPAPLAIPVQAGGHTEWFRGAEALVTARVASLARHGYRVHPLRGWLQAMLESRADRLHEWTLSQLGLDAQGLDGSVLEACNGDAHGAGVPVGASAAGQRVRDALDACAALDIELRARLPDAVWRWYSGPE